jgi:rhomboid protease GluP
MERVKGWFKNNIIAIMLVVIFIPIFIITQINDKVLEYIGTTSIEYLNNEFYRWITCIFYHYNFVHIFFNSLALICIGSLVSPFIGKWKTLLTFVLGGAIAEIPFSLIVHYGAVNYGGGSSGGIYALIAAFLVCYLRYPQKFNLKWYRLDLLIVLIFFVFANDNQSSFLTHVFGFSAGIILTSIMVISNIIKE